MIAPCGRCASPLEAEDLRCPVCAMPTDFDPTDVPDYTRAEILRCDSCGAAVSYQVERGAPACAFCGSVMHVELPDDPVEQAEAFLPFRVEIDSARVALRNWLGGLGFFRPSDLVSEAKIDELHALMWAGWMFRAEALVSWAADSNAGSGRAAWAPHAGQAPLELDKRVVSASRGLTAAEVRDLVPGYDVSRTEAEPPTDPTIQVERFDLPRSEARDTVMDAISVTAAHFAQQNWVPGRRVRNLKTSVLLRRLETRRLCFPAYVMAYRYKGELYRAVVHGQNAELVLGNAPYSLFKILMVVGASLAGLALILALVLGSS